MPLVTADEFRELFDISEDIPDTRFERALRAASTRLRSWVGDEVYADAVTLPPDEPERAEDLAYAEAHLAMGYAILGLNSPLRKGGVVSTEKAEGNTTLSYLSPAQLEKLQQEYFDTAETIARAYAINDGMPASLAFIEDVEDQF